MKKLIIIFLFSISIALIAIYFYSDTESNEINDKIRNEYGTNFIKSSNGYIHFEHNRIDSSPTVVLVHGFSSPMQTWNKQFSALVDSGFNVIRYDLFGRGYSDRPNAKYDLELFTQQLEELLSSLDIDTPVDLIGLSLGSHIVAEFTLKFKSKVRKVILLNPQITPLKNQVMELPLIGEFLMTTRVIPSFKFYPEQKKIKGFRRALLSTMRNFSGIDPIEKYERVSKSHKVALIWGNKDQNTSILNSKIKSKNLENIKLFRLDEAGHAAHFNYPEKVNTFIMQFLRNE